MHHVNPSASIRREDRVLAEVEAARDEIVAFTAEMIRIPTVNPPGACYRDCAELIGRRLGMSGLAVEYVEAEGRPEHTAEYPRVNVVGRGLAVPGRPRLHLNGHFDVVPPGDGWTVDPFAGVAREGRIYGRGASDMKSGIAAAVFAVEALRRAGVELEGAVDISATVDEESGGFAGVAHLCEAGIISSDHTRYAIIPEPFGPARVCLGHRGVYWFDVIAHGHAAHGSMSHPGRSAIDDMGALLEAFQTRLAPELATRVSALPVVPEPSRRPSLNVNAITGGQSGEARVSALPVVPEPSRRPSLNVNAITGGQSGEATQSARWRWLRSNWWARRNRRAHRRSGPSRSRTPRSPSPGPTPASIAWPRRPTWPPPVPSHSRSSV